MAHEYKLEPSDRQQRKMSPEHVWSAVPCIGVFKSEEDFIQYLRTYQAPKYGECLYLGIVGQERAVPLRIPEVNYEIVQKPETKQLTANNLAVGTMAVVTEGMYKGDVVLKTNTGLTNISRPQSSLTNDNCGLTVRLLEPGEEYTLRGR